MNKASPVKEMYDGSLTGLWQQKQRIILLVRPASSSRSKGVVYAGKELVSMSLGKNPLHCVVQKRWNSL